MFPLIVCVRITRADYVYVNLHVFLFQVAWMHFEQSAILTVHNHVITRNPRISVTHDKHRTWFLHINNVQEEDKGRYMCQINTVTAKTQFGYLHVVGESIYNFHCSFILVKFLKIIGEFHIKNTYILY